MRLIAKVPILYFAHLYEVGDELPLQNQTMIDAWLEDGQEVKKPAKRPKAKMATARPGQIGISTTGNEEDLAGRIPDTPARHV